ncbi:uncharacterized protein JN550_008928 [Neoarthrinium moseri]|uniref:uncharacterized protein n=1 Tax=Neoarthrinium moseri TaxID=1658444 RepID=UPI001FDD8013|nr:uncharacterized protein JN550_008928 [Neoarthrinium moseri]KAI1864371.1 hypothetical protein JN550_008928 [Neoarthrinium moseri]
MDSANLRCPRFGLTSLPTELILNTVEDDALPEADLKKLSFTCSGLYLLTRPYVLRKNAKGSASALRWACVHGNVTVSKKMLDLGASLNLCFDARAIKLSQPSKACPESVFADTPLITSIYYQHIELVQLLLDHGAWAHEGYRVWDKREALRSTIIFSANSEDVYQLTHWAVAANRYQIINKKGRDRMDLIIRVLLRYGARVTGSSIGLALANPHTTRTTAATILEHLSSDGSVSKALYVTPWSSITLEPNAEPVLRTLLRELQRQRRGIHLARKNAPHQVDKQRRSIYRDEVLDATDKRSPERIALNVAFRNGMLGLDP